MVDFGSGPGRSLFVTGGVAALRRGLQNDENADLGRKMPFPVGYDLKEYYFHPVPSIQPLRIQPDFDQPVGFHHGIDKS